MVSVKRSVLRIAMGLALLAIVFLAMLPHLMSSRVVYGTLLDRLKAEQFRLNVDSVELAWFAPVRLRGISIEQDGKKGTKLLQIREIAANKGLLGFLLSRQQLGKWRIVEPVIDIELLQEGSNIQDLARAIGGDKQSTKKERNTTKLDIDVDVEGASVVVRKADGAAPLVVVPPWNVSMQYRSTGDEPILKVAPTRWLDHVKLTPELMSTGLELALPALAKSAWLDGEISLDSKEIEVPLNRLVESRGDATIEFHNVRAGLQQPAMIAVASMLAKVAGRESDGEVVFMDNSQVLVSVQDGYVAHTGMKFGLPKLDPRLQVSTAGRVGMVDRSLAGTMDFPVPLQWLARTEQVRELGVPTVALPLTGTLDDPKVEWMAMRKESAELLSQIRGKLDDDAKAANAAVGLLEGLAGGSGDDAIRATADLLGQLREARKKRQSEQVAKDADPTAESEDASAGAGSEEANAPEPSPTRRRPLGGLLRRRNAE
jgi:hypothetical protein